MTLDFQATAKELRQAYEHATENMQRENESRLRAIEQAIVRASHAELMRICTSPQVPAEVKAQAKILIEESNKVLENKQ